MTLKFAAPGGIDLSGQRVQNITTSAATDAATKAYVDAAMTGLDWKASVRAATTTSIANLSNASVSIDGVTLVQGDRVLVKNGASPDGTAAVSDAHNGIYVVGTVTTGNAPFTRATDADSSDEVSSGLTVTSTEGTANGDKAWLLITNDPITLGTTALTFTQTGSSNVYVAGNGLTESPAGTFNVGAGTGITVAADAVAIDTAVVARKAAFNVGDGTATAYTLTHNLGTRDVKVEVYTNAAPYDTILVDAERDTINSVIVRFATAPAASAYRAVVVG